MIYTPRVCIDLLQHPKLQYERNKVTCTKIEYRGYEISISMDSSHGNGDLFRSNIRVYTNPGAVPGMDATSEFLKDDESMIYGTGEELHRIFNEIDLRSKD